MRYKTGTPRSELELGLLDKLIGPDHYVRLLDVFIESAVGASEESYSHKGLKGEGQKPYGARTMLKLYLYGYLNGVNSSRRLERECGRNIEVLWLLENLAPDFKTIADYRKDQGEAIRRLTHQFNQFLKSEGYISGKSVSIDGTKVKAHTHRDTLSVAKIEKRLSRIDREMTSYLKALDYQDQVEEKLAELGDLADQQAAALEKIAQLQAEIAALQKKKK